MFISMGKFITMGYISIITTAERPPSMNMDTAAVSTRWTANLPLLHKTAWYVTKIEQNVQKWPDRQFSAGKLTF